MTNTQRTHATTAVNTMATRTGRVRLVCQFCGKLSRSLASAGLADLPNGWTMAPYADDYTHPDGSTGNLFRCPTCNARRDFPITPRGYLENSPAEALVGSRVGSETRPPRRADIQTQGTEYSNGYHADGCDVVPPADADNMNTSAELPTLVPAAPKWAVSQDAPDPQWPNSTMHRGEEHAWGYTSTHLERFDVDGKEGVEEVCILVPTLDHPDGETINITLAGAAELAILLDRILEGLTAVEGMHAFLKVKALRTPSDASPDVVGATPAVAR